MPSRPSPARLAPLLGIVLLAASASRADTIVNFADLPLAPNTYWNGPVPGGTVTTTDDGFFRTVTTSGTFASGGVAFNNSSSKTYYSSTGGFAYDSWGDFAYSNRTDTTTAGFGNQYSAFTGGGLGDANYAIANGYTALAGPPTAAQLQGLPSITLNGRTALGLYVTNTTYAALSIRDGDSFNAAFGPGDWFKLTVYGLNGLGQVLGSSVDFYLADFRTASAGDNPLDHIVHNWSWLDLSTLSGAASLHFNLSSSDNGIFGMNTPAYFALDNLTLAGPAAVVPEPSSLALAGLGLAIAAAHLARTRRDAGR